MGKAKRWFKGLLGLKKDKDIVKSSAGEKREKKKWSFARSDKHSGGLTRSPRNFPARTDSAWMRSYVDRDSEEQSKHAIAVAAATAYAADAAFAAAQAAVAVVRLTSQGKGSLFTGGKENLAAVKIQNVFRGFLARKALKALKGLVKLQALVKGYLVRKRAAATLHSMQALFRAQNAARAHRARSSFNSDHRPEIRARKSIERFDENRSEFHSKRHSSYYDPALDESPKIVEIDTCGPKSRSRRICMPEYSDEHYYHAVSSPLPCPGTARLSIPDCRHLQECDWGYITEDYKFATVQNTPRFSCSGRAYGPVTPAKSVCGDVYFREYSNFPNYMANTQSFRAKTRSHSAPRHRPELGPKKQLSLDEMIASRSSFSGVRMQRSSCPQAEDGFEM